MCFFCFFSMFVIHAEFHRVIVSSISFMCLLFMLTDWALLVHCEWAGSSFVLYSVDWEFPQPFLCTYPLWHNTNPQAFKVVLIELRPKFLVIVWGWGKNRSIIRSVKGLVSLCSIFDSSGEFEHIRAWLINYKLSRNTTWSMADGFLAWWKVEIKMDMAWTWFMLTLNWSCNIMFGGLWGREWILF